MTTRRLHVAMFGHIKDKIPRASTPTVAELCAQHRAAVEVALVNVPPTGAAKGDGACFSPVLYKPGKGRAKGETIANIACVSAFVVDLDGVTAEAVGDVFQRLEGMTAWAWTTWGSGWSEDKLPAAWRIVVPLAVDVEAALWSDVWQMLTDRFAPSNDDATKDASRLHYSPRAPRQVPDAAGELVDNAAPSWREQDGALFDPSEDAMAARVLVAEREAKRLADEAERERRKAARDLARSVAGAVDPESAERGAVLAEVAAAGRARRYAERALDGECSNIRGAKQGVDWHPTMNRAGFAIGTLVAALKNAEIDVLGEDEARARLWGAAGEVIVPGSASYGADEAKRTIFDCGFAAGMKSPRTLPDFDDGEDAMIDPRSDDGGDLGSRADEGEGEPEAMPRADWLLTVADVVTEKVKWLWAGRIPLGKLTVLDGDPGLGKSTMTLDLAARVTRGDLMPDGSPGVCGDVLLLTAEDGVGDTIRPRLEAAGADLARVHVLTGFPDDEGKWRPVSIPEDCERIAEIVRARGVVFVVVDPLVAFLSAKRDSHTDSDVRRALHPLSKLAEDAMAAMLVVRHLNKNVGIGNPLYRGGGSIGIIGAARAGLLVGRDREDPDRRVLVVTKSNLSKEAPGLSYSIESHGEVGRVAWHGETAQDATSSIDVRRPQRASAEDAAAGMLRTMMLDAGGELRAKEAQAALQEAGFSGKTAQRAREQIGAVAVRSGFGAPCVWRLPDTLVQNGQNGGDDRNHPRHSIVDNHSGQAVQNGGSVQYAGVCNGALHTGQSPIVDKLSTMAVQYDDDEDNASQSVHSGHTGQVGADPNGSTALVAQPPTAKGAATWQVRPPLVGARRATVTHRIDLDSEAVGPELRGVFCTELARRLAADEDRVRLNDLCGRAMGLYQ